MPADVVDAPTPTAPSTESDEQRARAAAGVNERHDRDAERAAAAAEKARAKEEEQRRRAEAKAESEAAAAEQERAKMQARQQKADAKQRAKAERAEEKRRAQEAKQQAKEAIQQERHEPEAAGTHAAAGAAAVGATSVVEPEDPQERETLDEPKAEAGSEDTTPEAADTGQSSPADRADELEATQPIGRVQVDPDPEPEPEERSSGIRSAGSMVAAAVGILGLVFSVVLAVGALIVALGAGEGNAIYNPISTVCNLLAGPLTDAFSFSGPNAASREEFLGWGAGSLIYLAVSFAGQAAHRAATRD